MTKPTLLTWYPHSPTEWRRIVRGLSVEEEGALSRARDEAWDSDEHPAAIIDTPDTWARVLGVHWKRLLPVVKRFFTEASAAGVLRWPWLWELYREQLGRYAKRVTAGSEGGQKSAATRRERSNARSNAGSNAASNASSKRGSNPEASASNEKETGGSPGPYGPVGNHPQAAGSAPLTPGGVASPSANGVHEPPSLPEGALLAMAQSMAAEHALDDATPRRAPFVAPPEGWACDATPPAVPAHRRGAVALEDPPGVPHDPASG